MILSYPEGHFSDLVSSEISSNYLHQKMWHILALMCLWMNKGKGKGFPYSIPSVGPRADPGVQAVSPQ